ncbi:hypothetical protein ACFX1Z_037699 [Malus domestica]
MGETTISFESKRIAVVTGGNKGIGYEISRQLAAHGVGVVLTARDLDVTSSTSIASPAEFLKTQVGKRDILRIMMQLQRSNAGSDNEVVKQTYETARDCLKTNYYGDYYGVKQLTEALIPLLQKSNSAMIVNVSSSVGKLRVIPNEKAKRVLGDTNGLIEEEVDNLVEEFMEDVKQSLVEAKGWPAKLSAYIVSKAALNDYTRVLAKTYPNIAINAVDPSFTRTDKNNNTGVLTVKEGAKGPLKLALSPDSRVSSLYFEQTELSTFD